MTAVLTPGQATTDAMAVLEAAGIRRALAKSWVSPPAQTRPGEAAMVCTEVTVRRASDKYPALEAILRLPDAVLCSYQQARAVFVWRAAS